MDKIIFCNIGWMDNYRGLKTDSITGGGKHIKEYGWGGEIYNFQAYRGFTYGYVQPTFSTRANCAIINIDRLGANSDDEYIDGVLVIFTSTDPINKGCKVIGWYNDARVYRYSQKLLNRSRMMGDDYYHYFFRAAVYQCVLLPVDKRHIEVPRNQKGGMGQSNVWYCENNPAFAKEVRTYIKTGGITRKKGRVSIDIEKRLAVERAAILAAGSYYGKLGYDVKSVEQENLGWDLEAVLGNRTLHIEVKGLSGDFISVDLSVNEYQQMCNPSYQFSYRLVVVSKALSEDLELYVFNYCEDIESWCCEQGAKLKIDERVSAKLFLKK